jgi:hypothetical protein
LKIRDEKPRFYPGLKRKCLPNKTKMLKKRGKRKLKLQLKRSLYFKFIPKRYPFLLNMDLCFNLKH